MSGSFPPKAESTLPFAHGPVGPSAWPSKGAALGPGQVQMNGLIAFLVGMFAVIAGLEMRRLNFLRLRSLRLRIRREMSDSTNIRISRSGTLS